MKIMKTCSEFQRLMPDSKVGGVVAMAIPRVRCSTFPCHPKQFNENNYNN